MNFSNKRRHTVVYISPESLVCNPVYRNMLLSPIYKDKLVALGIDEAHCVKSWYEMIIIYSEFNNYGNFIF